VKLFGQDDRPEIDYPCDWEWTLVGRDEASLRDAVALVLAGDYTLRVSRTSRTGKYVSLQLSARVGDEAERLAIGRTLHGHRDVLFVF